MFELWKKRLGFHYLCRAPQSTKTTPSRSRLIPKLSRSGPTAVRSPRASKNPHVSRRRAPRGNRDNEPPRSCSKGMQVFLHIARFLYQHGNLTVKKSRFACFGRGAVFDFLLSDCINHDLQDYGILASLVCAHGRPSIGKQARISEWRLIQAAMKQGECSKWK